MCISRRPGVGHSDRESGPGRRTWPRRLAIEACGRGKRVRFWKVTELITQLIEAREERQLARMKSQLAKLDLLVLDELGYVPRASWGRSCCSTSSARPTSGPA